LKRAFSMLLVLALCVPAHAHLLNKTRIDVEIDPATGRFVVDIAIDLTRSFGSAQTYYEVSHALRDDPELTRKVILALASALEIQVDGNRPALTLDAFAWPNLAQASFTETWAAPMSRFRFSGALAPSARQLRVRLDERFPFERPIVLTATSPHHRYTRWVGTDQWSPVLALSADGLSEDELVAQDSAASIAFNYARQGFLHVLPSGLDHALFVIALLLGARTLRGIIIAISCFTLAHSITLALVATGFITPTASWVEALIAASIVYAAAANLVDRDSSVHRTWVVTGFGLLHGMGFAGALGELGLPADEFVLGLAAFNVGVEVAQVTIVLAFALSLWQLRQRSWNRSRVVWPGSLVIAAVAGYWMIERLQA
jgi:hypothetical protein